MLAPLVTPYSLTKVTGDFPKPPDGAQLLGTDQIGRDMLSRLLYAMRISLMVGALATLISTATGVVLGLLSGYFGGRADHLIMGFTDTVMSFPLHPAGAGCGRDL